MRFIARMLVAAMLLWAGTACADCVVGAKQYTQYQILNPNTLFLTSGSGRGIVIKSFSFFYTDYQITVLKDNFCDFEKGVLLVNGEVVDAQEVKQI